MKKTSPLHSMVLCALFAALTAVGAFLRVPLPNISFTLQVLFCCMAGFLLGPYRGAASQVIYILLGLVGLPIFTEGGGLQYFAQPTFGFLLGLIPMAFLCGLFSGKLGFFLKQRFLRYLSAGIIGLVGLYAVGLPYLYFSLGGLWSVGKTIVSGCLIFLPFDLLKITCAALLKLRLPRLPGDSE